ncbi:hypothetical protein BH24CHL7_BH24CHL7_07580 [soil metagenome]
MKFQAQAVLRRDDMQGPLRLVGVLIAGSFYPDTPQDAWGPLHLEVGLVALAPLTPIVLRDPSAAAARALSEARAEWADGRAPTVAGALAWQPIRGVRQPTDERSIAELIEEMSAANAARLLETPSTPPYHKAARELETLATAMFDTTSSEERMAEDGADQRDGRAAADQRDGRAAARLDA